MRSSLYLVVVLLASSLAAMASGGDLWVVGEEKTWDPNSQPSPEMLISIENRTGTPDLLYAWQLGLTIIPDPGATGSVYFQTATVPPSYLLNGRSGGVYPVFTGPASSISVIGDTDSLFSGVEVFSSGQNLLELTFSASGDASGSFQIAAVPGLFQGSNWYSSDFTAREYGNVPFSGEAVPIGTLNVVPEPAALVAITSGGLALAGISWLRRRRGRKATKQPPARSCFED